MLGSSARILAAATAGAAATLTWTAPLRATDEGGQEYSTSAIKCKDGTSVIPWSCPSRRSQIQKLKSGEQYDVLVVGGGCVGAGVALEAASRGLSVAIIERADWGSGTSGRSTKLIHGGVRYLEKAFTELDYSQFELVREALAERAHLLHAAPYMAHAMPIMIPTYSWLELPYMWLGAKMYDLIAGSKRVLPASRYLSKEEALYAFPNLKSEGLAGAVVYYDGMHNDTRMNLMIALTSAQSGATAANYVGLRDLVKDSAGRITGAVVEDTLTGATWNVKARVVVNATGPFADAVRLMDDVTQAEAIVPAAGVHVVMADHFCPDKMGLIVPKTQDGRVLFFLPWEGHALCGTTDSPAELSMTPEASEEDVSFILKEANRYLTTNVSRGDVKATWSGLRPLVKSSDTLKAETESIRAAVAAATEAGEDASAAATAARQGAGEGSNTSNFVRSHCVEVSDSGLVSILGGKWTTYRAMAQDTIDEVAARPRQFPLVASKVQPSDTLNKQLLGADRQGIVASQKFDRIVVTLRETFGMDKDVATHLVHNYGTRALQVAQMAVTDKGPHKLTHRLVARHPYLQAEIVFAVEQEMACKAVDFVARRTRLAFTDTKAVEACAERVVSVMGDAIGWDDARRQRELAEVREFMATMQ